MVLKGNKGDPSNPPHSKAIKVSAHCPNLPFLFSPQEIIFSFSCPFYRQWFLDRTLLSRHLKTEPSRLCTRLPSSIILHIIDLYPADMEHKYQVQEWRGTIRQIYVRSSPSYLITALSLVHTQIRCVIFSRPSASARMAAAPRTPCRIFPSTAASS